MGNCRYKFKNSVGLLGLLLVVFLKEQTTLTNKKKEEENNGNKKHSRTGGLFGKLQEDS